MNFERDFRKLVVGSLALALIVSTGACKSTPEQLQAADGARVALDRYNAVPPEVTLEEVKERCKDAKDKLKQAQSDPNGKEMSDAQKEAAQKLMKDCEKPAGSNDSGPRGSSIQSRSNNSSLSPQSKAPSLYSLLVNKDIAELVISFFLTSQDFDLIDSLFQSGLKDGSVDTMDIYVNTTRF